MVHLALLGKIFLDLLGVPSSKCSLAFALQASKKGFIWEQLENGLSPLQVVGFPLVFVVWLDLKGLQNEVKKTT